MAKKVQEIRPGLLGVPGPVNAWTTQNLMGLALAGLTVMAWPHIVIGTMQVKSMVVVRKTAIWMLLFSLIFCNIAAIISFVLALVRPTELGLLLSNIASPGFALWLPALIGGVLWRRGTKEGAIVGIFAGLVLLIVGSFFYKPLLLGFHPIFVPLLVDALLYIGVSLITSPVPQSVQKKFFDDIEDYLEEHTLRGRSLDNGKVFVTPKVAIETVRSDK